MSLGREASGQQLARTALCLPSRSSFGNLPCRMMSLLLALILVVVLLGCWLVTLGNWLMVMATAIYAYRSRI